MGAQCAEQFGGLRLVYIVFTPTLVPTKDQRPRPRTATVGFSLSRLGRVLGLCPDPISRDHTSEFTMKHLLPPAHLFTHL